MGLCIRQLDKVGEVDRRLDSEFSEIEIHAASIN